MGYYPEFGELVATSLYDKERSASWLAQRLHVSATTIGRWLNHGTRPGSPEMVVCIADVLGIDAEKLLVAAGYGYIEVQQSSIQTFDDSNSSLTLPKNQLDQHDSVQKVSHTDASELPGNAIQNSCIQNIVANGDIHINIELTDDKHFHQYDTLVNNVVSKEGSVYINLKQATQDQNETDSEKDEFQEPDHGVQLHLFEQLTDNREENQYTEPLVQRMETVEVTC